MKRITIKLPNDNGKWGLSFGKGLKKRNSAGVIFGAIERRLRGYASEEKLVIMVREDGEIVNETLKTNDYRYLLYTTGCFLEDFLSEPMMKNIEGKYL